jgi:hypothetical protein
MGIVVTCPRGGPAGNATVVYALQWKCNPISRNGNLSWFHYSGPQLLCHNIYSILNIKAESIWLHKCIKFLQQLPMSSVLMDEDVTSINVIHIVHMSV